MTKKEWKNIWEIVASALLAFGIIVVILNIVKAFI